MSESKRRHRRQIGRSGDLRSRWYESAKARRVVLIRPPVSRWRLYKWYSLFGSREAPLGLVYLASYLQHQGIRVTLLDGERVAKKSLLIALKDLKPDLVGLTSTTFSFFPAADLIEDIRRLLPDALIIMGGPHVSSLPVDSLQRVPELDGCVVGEGEETLLEIAQGHPASDISGLVWRDSIDRQIRMNQGRALCTDLDRYSLDWSLLDLFPSGYQLGWQDTGRHGAASIVASRGCSYSCSFCACWTIHGRAKRSHSPAYVIGMMENLQRSEEVTNFYFRDDNFTQDRRWLREFCDLLRAKNLPIRWSCSSRTDLLDDPTLKLMQESGCFQIGVGIESGSERVLKWMNKQASPEDLENGVRRIQQAGIQTKVFLIIGTPEEQFSDLISSVRLLGRLNVDNVQMLYFTPLPGSDDFLRYPVPANLWSSMNLLNPVIKPGLPVTLLRFIELLSYSFCYCSKIMRRRRRMSLMDTGSETPKNG